MSVLSCTHVLKHQPRILPILYFYITNQIHKVEKRNLLASQKKSLKQSCFQKTADRINFISSWNRTSSFHKTGLSLNCLNWQSSDNHLAEKQKNLWANLFNFSKHKFHEGSSQAWHKVLFKPSFLDYWTIADDGQGSGSRPSPQPPS